MGGPLVWSGEYAWAVPLTLGMLATVADGGPAQRVSSILTDIPLVAAVAAALLAAAAYVWRGPRRA